MKQQYKNFKTITVKRKWPRWFRWMLRGIGILFLRQIIFGVAVIWYVKSHKPEILAMVAEKLNENLHGKLTIADMEPTFFENFPRISLHLKNVAILDMMYSKPT
jgi:hypothetical protein